MQAELGEPLLPSPQMQAVTDMLFEPLHERQNLNAARWDIQSAKNDALLKTAKAYFEVHKYRGQYAGAVDTVLKGRQLVAAIAELSRDLVSGVEVDRAAEPTRRPGATSRLRPPILAPLQCRFDTRPSP